MNAVIGLPQLCNPRYVLEPEFMFFSPRRRLPRCQPKSHTTRSLHIFVINHTTRRRSEGTKDQ